MNDQYSRIVNDLNSVFAAFPLKSLRHVRENAHRLTRRQYQDEQGGGCLFALLSELLPPAHRIFSPKSLTKYFGGDAEAEQFAAPRALVRLWDGLVDDEHVIERYGHGAALSKQFLLQVLDAAIAARVEQPFAAAQSRRHTCDGSPTEFYELDLPNDLLLTDEKFDDLWDIHPAGYHQIRMHGRTVKTPRWQQAYGDDYHYTGNVNRALPMDNRLQPYLEWARQEIDGHLSGVLVNWYDDTSRHYIGAHRDSTVKMVGGSPIVMVSLGGPRTFRLRPWKRKGFLDYTARNGTVFVLPFETNGAWTHEVLKPNRTQHGRRISITLRAFESAEQN